MKISVIGTGVMGTMLAKALMENGQEVIVYNRTTSKTAPLVELGAKAVSTAAQALNEADASIILLSNIAAIRDVLLSDETKTFLSGRKILVGSTTSVDDIKAFANEVSEFGGNIAQTSFTLFPGKENGEYQGYFHLGSDDSVTTLWSEILKDIAEVHHIGEVGDASRAEAPMLLSGAFLTLGMIFSSAVGLKLNLPKHLIIEQVSLLVPGADFLMPTLLDRQYNQGLSTVDGYMNVIANATKIVEEAGMPTKVLDAILDLFKEAISRGLGTKAETAILEVLLNREDKKLHM